MRKGRGWYIVGVFFFWKFEVETCCDDDEERSLFFFMRKAERDGVCIKVFRRVLFFTGSCMVTDCSFIVIG